MPYHIDVQKSSKGRIAHYPMQPVREAHRGWVFGPFVKTPDGSPLSHSFEVRMEALPKGASRTEWSTALAGECVHFCITGHFRLFFLVDDKEVVVDVRTGEACVWDNAVPHKWEMMEDTNYVCVRTLR